MSPLDGTAGSEGLREPDKGSLLHFSRQAARPCQGGTQLTETHPLRVPREDPGFAKF